MIFDIGRVIIKTKGRDANKPAVVVDVLDNKYVLIDGFKRKRKCNITHLEPLDKTIKIKKNEKTETIKELLKKEGFNVKEKKVKRSPRKPKEKPETKKSKKK